MNCDGGTLHIVPGSVNPFDCVTVDTEIGEEEEFSVLDLEEGEEEEEEVEVEEMADLGVEE